MTNEADPISDLLNGIGFQSVITVTLTGLSIWLHVCLHVCVNISYLYFLINNVMYLKLQCFGLYGAKVLKFHKLYVIFFFSFS